MSSVFTRKLEERPELILNHELQPVHEDSKIRSEFGSFLGTIGRQCVPLDYVNWSRVSESEKNGWWEFVKTKYIIPEEGKDWVLKTICDAWRMYKSRFKAEYYTKYDNDEDRLKNRPQSIPLEKFKILLQYWGDEKIKSTAVKNANNRRKVIDTHTAGRTSFAQIRNDMKKVQSTPDTPTKADIYPKTRKNHEKKATKDAEGNDIEEEADANAEDMAEEAAKTVDEIDSAAHGPNWLVGRSGRTSKTRNITTHKSRKAEELATLRKEIAAEITTP
ncbi:uncharacterized protein LOC135148442 [Daucus carota subsp. sativus]|uniref:uncharacterized protein LOC135148442 n=1 Tax=Daucus carota subsp. sativus TaxID=79200 RepID=UPI003083533D